MAETRLPAKPLAAAASELVGFLSRASPIVASVSEQCHRSVYYGVSLPDVQLYWVAVRQTSMHRELSLTVARALHLPGGA